jgi:hypothetical protein
MPYFLKNTSEFKMKSPLLNKKKFKKKTKVKDGKTYDKTNTSKPKDYSNMTTEELMRIKAEKGL